MGADAARITAEDFLIPPEFQDLKLAAGGAGRIGGLRLEIVRDGRTTRLGRCYQQAPLRVLPAFQLDLEQPTLVYLLAQSPGLMDGDGQQFAITARAGTRAVLTGQSATRLHPCLHRFSTQQWRVRVEAGAVLVVLPGPLIPFRDSRYYQQVLVDLEPGAGLVWGDIWLAGRYARGALSEHFQFNCLVQQLLIRRAGRVVYRDRFAWHGPWDSATARWHFGSNPTSSNRPPRLVSEVDFDAVHHACGSLFVTGLAEGTNHPSLPGTARFATAAGDTCIRCHGASEAVIKELIDIALRTATKLAGRGASCWLRDTDHLAPNHWFSAPVYDQCIRT